MFIEVKRQNLYKSIIKIIQEYIIVNNLKQGDKLPTEKDLAERLKVGKNSVREALKALEIFGLVSSKAGRGTTICSGGFDSFLYSLIFGIALEDIEIKHLNELRLIIELGACRLVIDNATNKEINELFKIAVKLDSNQLEYYEKDIKSVLNNLVYLEMKFHKYLIEISHNPILMKFINFWDIYFLRIKESGELFKAQEINVRKKKMHTAIVNAIKERDKERAVCEMQTHLFYYLRNKEDIPKSILINLINGIVV